MNRRYFRDGLICLVVACFLAVLISCGAGEGNDTNGSSGSSTSSSATSVLLLVSKAQLDSDGASTVTLTAIVKDSSNRALLGETVSFTSDSGLLTIVNDTTGSNGTAEATLGTGGDPTNRRITVNASAGDISVANSIDVTGTTLSISGSSSLSFGDSTPLTIFLKDSSGTGIPGKTVTVASQNGNTLTAADSYVTDANGQVIVTVTATVGGADKITASAIGATKESDLTVNASILTFTNPAPPPADTTEIPIGTVQPISVKYTIGGAVQSGVTVNFITTRGSLSVASAVTNATGIATVNASSTNSGPVLFLASIDDGPSAQVAAEFVATTVDSVTLQAAPNTIGTNDEGVTTEKSLITAVVRDANDNLVKNQTVNFSIVSDASGGSLSPASANTDSSGTANTYYIAGDATSALNGVTIRGSVAGTTVASTTTLTVAKKPLFITLQTGPFIEEYDDIRYKKDYVALVTDAAGDPVEGATVDATIRPVYYKKGYFTWGGMAWHQVDTLQAASCTLPSVPACANEDGMLHNSLDFNGVLNTGEDQNGNGLLDPGNVASVTATETDATGGSTLTIVYAKDYAQWVNVKLEAHATTGGSTASASVTFDLPGLANDYTNQNADPPGNPSPFGITTSCFVDLSVVPLSMSQMSITWQESTEAASYNIYRDGAYLKNVVTNSTTDTGLTAGTQYCYEIRTVDDSDTEAAFTGTSCASTNAAVVVVPVPTGLTATGGVLDPGPPEETYKVTLTWNASAGAAIYRIYRDGSATPVMSSTATTVIDEDVEHLTGYCYTVSAVSTTGEESEPSASFCTATP